MGNRTRTHAFGTPTRIGHDSSKFYDRKMFNGHGASVLPPTEPDISVPPGADTDASVLPVGELATDVRPPLDTNTRVAPNDKVNQIYCHTSESMTELPDHSVHLVVTSPPYNVGKEYDDDLSISEYEGLLSRVFSECHRVLVEGGRVCVNIANVGRKPYVPLNALVAITMIRLGYFMRGEIIWNKGASAGVSCAWGSWMSPSNPVLRDVHEYILVFSKGSYSRSAQTKKATIEKEGFLEWTKSIWDFPAASARKVGHPAPFPVELPLRLIKLYTYRNDIVLDPFMGAGSTALASLKTHRKWVGYDTSSEYCELTRQRVDELLANESLFD